jgi:hypothetical protein
MMTEKLFLVMIAGLLSACVGNSKAKIAELDDPPIITSASYQHTLYNGQRQPIDARAAKDDVPPLVITYFHSEENLLQNVGGTTEAPSDVGTYFAKIERPAGNGYREGPSIKVEYHIQKPLSPAVQNEPVQPHY